MKKNLYLVQVDIARKLPARTTAYLPYAAGALWICARQARAVAEAFTLRDMLFLREPVDRVIARMEAPYLVGFSCYSWNTEYNKALAQAMKKRFPSCLVLFGGHNVPPGGAMLEELPYVDFLMHGEGELGFRALLTELAKQNPDFERVPGLSWRGGENPARALDSLESVPSPYLEGVFEPIIAAHPEIQWSTVWETNRGCPSNCVYCDWGSQDTRLRQFPMKRLLAEIEWLTAHRVEYVFCADANFGILPRDEEILDAWVTARARTGYPDVLECLTTKTPGERLFRIVEKLNRSGLDRVGPDIAMQSLSPLVMRNVGREALEEETFSRWIRRFRRAGYRTHTDLILGLPGETLQSFCAGVEKLFALGQHEGVQFFLCNLLPGAAMAVPAYREKHRIRTARVPLKPLLEDAPATERIDEFCDVVTETAAMPHEDWRTAAHFLFLAQAAHGFGLLRLVAMYLHTQGISSYSNFYLRLLEFCRAHPQTLPGEVMARVEQSFAEGIHGREPAPLQIPGFSFGRMAEAQYFFSRAVLAPERFYADIEPFLRQFDLEPELFEQLLRYQRESVVVPGAALGAEKALEFGYDFPAYFNAIYGGEPMPLQKKTVRLRFRVPRDLSTAEKYYDAVVHNGRFSNNAFYAVEYVD